MAALTLSKVVKVYGKNRVIHGLDLEVKDKEFLVLVGPSGCGKSTLLRMVAGLEPVSQGTISMDGRVINSLSPKDRNLAMVFQDYALYPHMTVYGNMAFGLKLAHVPKQEIRQRVHDTAAILGLQDLLSRRPHELSGGQCQRVAMGRAMVRNPSVFLFDEPLSNLDTKLRIQMRSEIKLLRQRVQSTTLYVTHDQVEAMTLADRIVVLRDGSIEQVGSPMELFLRPANTFVAGFIGSPPMNLVRATISMGQASPVLAFASGLTLPIPEREGKGLVAGKEVFLGIRPEDISPWGGVRPVPEQSCQTEAEVLVIEPMGNETHLHLRVGGMPFLSKADGMHPFAPGERIRIAFNLQAMYLFDGQTGQCLSSREEKRLPLHTAAESIQERATG